MDKEILVPILWIVLGMSLIFLLMLFFVVGISVVDPTAFQNMTINVVLV